MIFYAIFENGFVSKITAKNEEEACDKYDETTIVEDGNGILVSKKEAIGIAKSIIHLHKKMK